MVCSEDLLVTRLEPGNADLEALPPFPAFQARQSKSDMGSQALAWEPVKQSTVNSLKAK